MKNCRCYVFKFIFLFRFLWLLISVLSHLLMNKSRFIYSYLIVYWCRSIFLFFLQRYILNEICFDWDYKTWKRWNFVMTFGLSKCHIFALFCLLKAKSLFSFCCYLIDWFIHSPFWHRICRPHAGLSTGVYIGKPFGEKKPISFVFRRLRFEALSKLFDAY